MKNKISQEGTPIRQRPVAARPSLRCLMRKPASADASSATLAARINRRRVRLISANANLPLFVAHDHPALFRVGGAGCRHHRHPNSPNSGLGRHRTNAAQSRLA
jgi:hypothetical protein